MSEVTDRLSEDDFRELARILRVIRARRAAKDDLAEQTCAEQTTDAGVEKT